MEAQLYVDIVSFVGDAWFLSRKHCVDRQTWIPTGLQARLSVKIGPGHLLLGRHRQGLPVLAALEFARLLVVGEQHRLFRARRILGEAR